MLPPGFPPNPRPTSAPKHMSHGHPLLVIFFRQQDSTTQQKTISLTAKSGATPAPRACHRARCALTTASLSFCSKSRFSTQPSQASPCAKSSSRNCFTRSLEKSSSGRNAAAVVRQDTRRESTKRQGGGVNAGELDGESHKQLGYSTYKRQEQYDRKLEEIRQLGKIHEAVSKRNKR